MAEGCECTIEQVARAFRPNGMLCNFVLTVGTFLLGQKYKHSEKLVVPSICAVSSFSMLHI